MVRIAISQAAFDAIASTLPPGSAGYENAVNEKGERRDLAGASDARQERKIRADYDTSLYRRRWRGRRLAQLVAV